MDESAAAVTREDDADKNYPHKDDGTCENKHHLRANNPGDGVGGFCCREYGGAFREEAAYLEHRHLHLQPKTYLNNQPDAEKDNETPYFCTLCSLSFVDINILRSHLMNHHRTTLKESGIVNIFGLTKQDTCVCPDCGKTYAVIGHFLNHLRLHRQPSKPDSIEPEQVKEKPFQCETCGRNYSRASALDAHRRCHDEKLIKPKNRSSGDASQTGESVVERKLDENQTKKHSEKCFECSCGRTFAALSGLKAHQRFSSQCAPYEVKQTPRKEKKEFCCTKCDKSFSGRIALSSHQRWHTNNSNSAERFTCEECGKAFTTPGFCYKHQRMAHIKEIPAKSFFYQVGQVQKKAFECQECGLKFSRASALQSHQLQHIHDIKETAQRARTVETEPGSQTLETQPMALDAHRECHEEKLIKPQNRSSGDTSQTEESVVETKLNKNQTKKHSEKYFQCLCGRTFASLSGLKAHQRFSSQCAPDGRREFCCTKCDKAFGIRIGLINHQRWHTNNSNSAERFTCEECGKAFTTPGFCYKHQRMAHNKEIPAKSFFYQVGQVQKKAFECQECGMKFSRASALQSHQLQHIHDIKEPVQRACTVETEPGSQTLETQPMALDAHSECREEKLIKPQNRSSGDTSQTGESVVETKLNKNQTKQQSEKYFQCLCGRTFASLSGLKAHQRFSSQCAPDGRREFCCTKCDKAFSIRIGLINHQRWHTNNSAKKFTCEECGKAFTTPGFCYKHQRMAHNKEIPAKSFFYQVGQVQKKAFECQECGMKFSRASALQSHQLQRSHVFKETVQSAQTLETQPMAQTLETQPMAQTLKTELEFQTLETQPMAQTLKTELEFQTLETQPIAQTPETELGVQTLETQLMAQTLKTELGVQTLETQPIAQTPETELGVQTLETQLMAQTLKTELGTQSQETELGAQMCLPHQDMISEGCWKKSELFAASVEEKVQSCNVDNSQTNESDEDIESYEPGDFNVQVISDSESEEEAAPDLNPDLELLCESDQDVRDDADYQVSTAGLSSKSDLKIVRIDFDQTNKQSAPMEGGDEPQTAQQRFDCPDCYRWFTNATSLRSHRMWHRVRMRRQQNQGQSVACETHNYEAQFIHTQFHSDPTLSSDLLNQAEGLKKTFTCNECGDVFSNLSALVSHQLHHPKRKQFQCPDCMMSYLHTESLFNHMKNCSAQKRDSSLVSQKEYNPKKTLLGPKIYHCEQCGKGFWSLGAFSHHKQNQMECTDLRLRKGLSGSLHSANGRSRSVTKVTCPICGRKFRHKGTMTLHMRRHENGNHKCEICNRSFRLFSSLLRHEVVHSDQLLPPPSKSFQHQVEQLKKNTYSCPDCGKLFSREKALQFHMKSHGYESGKSLSSPQSMVKVKNLQCATCFAHFNNKTSLRAHQKLCVKRDGEVIVETELAKNAAVIMHSDPNTQEHLSQMKRHVGIKNDGDIGARHIEVHTDGGIIENPDSTHLKYKCNACDKSFPVAGALNFHKRIHIKGNRSKLKPDIVQPLMFKSSNKEESGKDLIHCSDCGRRFMTKSALGSHRRWHKEKSSHEEDDFKSVSHKAEDGPFQCKKCQKQFFNHRVLHRHQVFNPQCQTKTKPDLNRTMETEQFSRHVAHCKILEVAEDQGEPLNHTPEHKVNIVGDKTLPSAVKPKPHQCSLCFMTFAKARGLHAHKWQAHPKSKKCKNKRSEKKRFKSHSRVDQEEDSEMVKSSSVRKKTRPNPPPEMSISCLDCGEQCSSTACLLAHKKVCSPVKRDAETLKAAAEVPPALGHPSEHAVKCLFKCDKCGKAFQTEAQLGTHKNKAKSRPHCCALCCHGFWTESQLLEHLAWHDQVRCRLPNEVRFRLSAAVTSNPSKPNFPLHTINQPPPNPAGCSETEGQHDGRSEQCSHLYRCLMCSRTFSHVKDLIDHHQECVS